MDIDLMRLEYEILGTPLKALARCHGLSEAMLQDEARKSGWTPIKTAPLYSDDSEEDAEQLENLIELYTKRLSAFYVAKETLLATRKANLELSVINKLTDALDAMSLTNAKAFASAVGLISAMRDKSFSRSKEDALPLAIVRDFTGS
jgi:hypothetical protein